MEMGGEDCSSRIEAILLLLESMNICPQDFRKGLIYNEEYGMVCAHQRPPMQVGRSDASLAHEYRPLHKLPGLARERWQDTPSRYECFLGWRSLARLGEGSVTLETVCRTALGIP